MTFEEFHKRYKSLVNCTIIVNSYGLELKATLRWEECDYYNVVGVEVLDIKNPDLKRFVQFLGGDFVEEYFWKIIHQSSEMQEVSHVVRNFCQLTTTEHWDKLHKLQSPRSKKDPEYEEYLRLKGKFE